MRIAFLTPEYATTSRSAGGLASYLGRMAPMLAERGHDPEVFVIDHVPRVYEKDGVRVETVRGKAPGWLRKLNNVLRTYTHCNFSQVVRHLSAAKALAGAMERRHLFRPFDAVQSTNYGLAGFFVSSRQGRTHLLRLSSSQLLWQSVGGRRLTAGEMLLDILERRLMKKADLVYAPSKYLSDHFRTVNQLDVAVLRPPILIPSLEDGTAQHPDVKRRYIIHFGQISPRKGSELVAKAVSMARKRGAEYDVVFAGTCTKKSLITECRELLGTSFDYMGALERSRLYDIVRGAEAAVLPARVDNMPNAVLEALALGVPVIGSRGASIDEVVVDGVCGRLVPIGDLEALAAAILAAWKREEGWTRKNFSPPATLAPFAPDVAVENFLHLCRSCASDSRRLDR